MTWLIDVVVGVECRFGYIGFLNKSIDWFDIDIVSWSNSSSCWAEVVSRRLMSILL